jgi:glycosyltransferase involved in cell wall biosynthesis
VTTLSLGVDLSQFRRWNWGRQQRIRVVSAGNVAAHKRPELFLRCAELFPEADFIWFGEGAMRGSLQASVRGSGLTNVDFPGALAPESLAREFAQANIFVMPSLAEGVPKVTQEAAASGLAQVICGFYEAPTVVDGRNGFVVWSDDQFILKLRELIQNPDLVERMGQAGSVMAADWSWETVAPQWESRIIDVLENQANTSGQHGTYSAVL